MALIDDPDALNQSIEIDIDPVAKTVTLNLAGGLSDDGVTLQALYSFMKEEWRTDAGLIAYPFPLVSITPEQYEFIQDWRPTNDATRNLFRSAGWREIEANGTLNREYAGIISLGNIDPADTPYYAFAGATSKTDFDFPGVINQGIQTYGDAANGNFDVRNSELTLYIRVEGKTYGSATSTSIGLSSLSYIAYRFPLSEGPDNNILVSDSDIATLAPYTSMAISYGSITRTIGGVVYNYDQLIAGNVGSLTEIYAFSQWSLRQDADIDSSGGTVNGLLAAELLDYSAAPTLRTLQGVYIDDFDAAGTNDIVLTDTSDTGRVFPFVATGALLLNNNLEDDPLAIVRMFFASGFGTAGFEIVDDSAGTPIAYDVAGQASIPFSFAYDNNTQGGRTAGTDADVVVVALGTNGAQYVRATATISKANGQNISLVSPLERNYTT